MRNGNFPLQHFASGLLPHAEDIIPWQDTKKKPVTETISRGKKRNILLEELYNALLKRCHKLPPPAYEEWVSTRVLAEDCRMGIYQTRSILLKLVEQQRVIVTPTPIANSLRWYAVIKDGPTEPAGK